MKDGASAQLWSALLLAAALIAAPWRGHIDDVDAQLYLVLVRHLGQAHNWIDLQYLPGLLPHFREHLPFGFWPGAAAFRIFGEWAVAPAYGLMTWLSIAVAARVSTRLAGPWAGVATAIALGTCESIWQYGGRVLLEPPLFLLTTLSIDAVLRDRPDFRLASFWAALAVLVKGPFGLLPLACVVMGLGPRYFLRGALASLVAVVPLAAFLEWDRRHGSSWWNGYLRDQLLASATGQRADGVTRWWFPLAVIAGRFWPGLPFTLAGAFRSNRWARPLAIACLLVAVLLCLPHRKWGNHSYVSFPLLAILAGLSASSLIEKLPRILLPALAALAWILSVAGLGKRVLQPPCVVHGELAEHVNRVARGEEICVVAPTTDWLTIGELAAERDLLPFPRSSLPAGSGAPRYALVHSGTEVGGEWRTVGRAGDWLFVER